MKRLARHRSNTLSNIEYISKNESYENRKLL